MARRIHMRNGRGYRSSILPCDTRKELRERLAEEGYALKTEKRNLGEWNEGMYYFAVKGDKELLLDNPAPGERRDWAGMWSYFVSKQTMFD